MNTNFILPLCSNRFWIYFSLLLICWYIWLSSKISKNHYISFQCQDFSFFSIIFVFDSCRKVIILDKICMNYMIEVSQLITFNLALRHESSHKRYINYWLTKEAKFISFHLSIPFKISGFYEGVQIPQTNKIQCSSNKNLVYVLTTTFDFDRLLSVLIVYYLDIEALFKQNLLEFDFRLYHKVINIDICRDYEISKGTCN